MRILTFFTLLVFLVACNATDSNPNDLTGKKELLKEKKRHLKH